MANKAWVSVTPGLEAALTSDLRQLGVRHKVGVGGAEIDGDDPTIHRVHVLSRVGARVTVTVGTVRGSSPADLARGIRALPWKRVLTPHQPFTVKATVRGGPFRHATDASKRITGWVREGVGRVRRGKPVRIPVTLHALVEKGQTRITVDASGELLHRRGWRRHSVEAPIRENIAAALLRMADWSPGEALVDPMCGSGTFGIEAAQWDLGIAPGARRRFAFEAMPGHDERAYRRFVDRLPKPAGGDAPIVLNDRYDKAVTATRANAKRAGVSRRVRIAHGDASSLEPPASRGLVVVNPPYGKRLERGQAEQAYRALGRALRGWSGWRFGILAPTRSLFALTGLSGETVTTFQNGGVRVHWMVGDIR